MRMLLHPCNVFRVSRPAYVRGFTSSVPNRYGFGGPIEITAELFRAIHDVSGLTYGVTIPLTALALRTIVTLPLSIYSQKKLNRRIELRPLYYQWGELIGMQALAQQKSRNADLRDKGVYEKTMSRVQKLVHFITFRAKQPCRCRKE
jgi:hypothetical protein